MPRAAIVSFRLGMTDGVSIVAASWARALGDLGFEVVSIAGAGTPDIVIRGLAVELGDEFRGDGAGSAPGRSSGDSPAWASPPSGLTSELRAALDDVDLVIAENILTIPLNLPASIALAEVLRGRPAILHHHDPPWQRDHLAHITSLPVDDPAWRHVTINRLTEVEMAVRGINATTIYNGFELPEASGDRAGVRSELGIGAGELLVAHPVRAIPRKNIPAAISLTEELGGTYWLLGPAEDGYDSTLAELLEAARCRVIHRPWEHGPDLYAAPDLIAFPSTWEGFGNPPVEAAVYRRLAVVGSYPVADELRSLGFDWPEPGEMSRIRGLLGMLDADGSPMRGSELETMLDLNEATARSHFSQDVVRDAVSKLLDAAGWLP